ncbi:hypothetical protein CMI41_03895 [Candidatus Pacearchaeota archaeon]|nr:hypothetical protein [Candidatus Pacearchaeota archaeon]|tara:strand:- start:4709 stop:5014 length:306 start_codon:yes stop_codon:yes gene_type:complete
MTSTIREPTRGEIIRAQTFAEEIRNDPAYTLVKETEKRGFKVFASEDLERMVVLMPSNDALDWDFNPRSLDALEYHDRDMLNDATTYAGLYASYLFEGVEY